MLVLIDGLRQLHILVHEDDGEDLPGPVCLVALCLVEVQTGMEAHFTCKAWVTVTASKPQSGMTGDFTTSQLMCH